MEERIEEKKKKFVKIPQTRTTIIRNVVFAAGLLSLVVGFLLLLNFTFGGWDRFPLGSTVAILVGIVAIFLVFALSKNGLLLAVGLTLTLSGALSLLCASHLIPLSMKQLWPAVGIFAAFSIVIAGLYKNHKIRSLYFFPAVIMAALGVLFLLFSLDVIDYPLAEFISRWWPVLFIIIGIVLISIFIYQQRHNKDFPYMDDEENSDSSFTGE